MPRRSWLIVVGLCLSAVLLFFVVRQLDWTAFWDALARVEVWPIGIAVVTTVGVITLRALRWHGIASAPRGDFLHFWRAFNIGQLGNFIYPLRGGDVLRLVAISRLANLPPARAVTSGVLDRFADGAIMGIMLIAVLVAHGSGALGGVPLGAVVGAVAAACLALAIFVAFGRRAEGLIDLVARRLPGGIGKKLPGAYAHAIDVSSMLRSPKRLATVAGLSALAAAADYFTVWLVARALGWDLPFFGAVTVGVFLHAGVSVPSAPGYVGVYQVAAILGLGLYGVSVSDAVAFSILHQLMGVVTFTVLGSWSAMTAGVSLWSRKGRLPVTEES